jgi:hypothetical protein
MCIERKQSRLWRQNNQLWISDTRGYYSSNQYLLVAKTKCPFGFAILGRLGKNNNFALRLLQTYCADWLILMLLVSSPWNCGRDCCRSTPPLWSSPALLPLYIDFKILSSRGREVEYSGILTTSSCRWATCGSSAFKNSFSS